VVHKTRNRAISFTLNYPEFPDGCCRVELVVVVNGLEMFAYGPNILVEQIGELPLREPKAATVESHLHAHQTILVCVEQEVPTCRFFRTSRHFRDLLLVRKMSHTVTFAGAGGLEPTTCGFGMSPSERNSPIFARDFDSRCGSGTLAGQAAAAVNYLTAFDLADRYAFDLEALQ
jgi:hypothetical protein